MAVFGQQPARHHRLIIAKYQALQDGKATKRRLLIMAPPGSAKSTYARIFVAWLLAHQPGCSVLTLSHVASFAEKNSGRVQAIVREHAELLGIRLVGEAREGWSVSNGSEVNAIGVDGTSRGLRADLLLLDDPISDLADAMSEHTRARGWYESLNASSARLVPGYGMFAAGRWEVRAMLDDDVQQIVDIRRSCSKSSMQTCYHG
jgi:hypothetical protein